VSDLAGQKVDSSIFFFEIQFRQIGEKRGLDGIGDMGAASAASE
jgi:hypothetical protein